MRSARPKPLHLICGRPMVMHVIHALADVDVERTVVVVGHGAERVTKKVQEQAPAGPTSRFVEQSVQRGTGDAAMVGITAFPGDDLDDTSTIIVLPGDTPLLRAETLESWSRRTSPAARRHAADHRCSTTPPATAASCGAQAGEGRVLHIVEQRDASFRGARDPRGEHQHLRVPPRPARPGAAPPLPRQLPGRVLPHRRRRLAGGMGHRIGSVRPPADETQGVNDRWQLALAERELRSRTNRHWLLNGVTMLDPRQTFIDVTVQLGRDVTLYPGTILQGTTVDRRRLRDRPRHPAGRLRGRRRRLVENTVGRDAEIGDDAHVGPYAYLPPGSSVPSGGIDGSLLHCTCTTEHARRSPAMEKVTTKRMSLYSGRTHPALAEEVAEAARRRARRRRTSSSSPTARSAHASPRASAAATCSSCRRTTAATGAASTTRSWSS